MSVFNRLIPLCQPLLVTKITFCETKLVFPVGDVNGDSIKHAMIIVNNDAFNNLFSAKISIRRIQYYPKLHGQFLQPYLKDH